MKKANNSVFNQACELYAAIGKEPSNQALINEYNALIEQYDFRNEVIYGADNCQGLALCTGEVIIPAIYDCMKFATGSSIPPNYILAVGVREDKEYLIDSKGREIFSADEICPESWTIIPFAFRIADSWGMASTSGKVIIPAVMDKIEWGGNGLVFFLQSGKWGILTPFGEMIPPKFDSVGWDIDDNLEVTLNGEKGYIGFDAQFTTEPEKSYYNLSMDL